MGFGMAPVNKHDDCPFKDVVFPAEKMQATEPDHRMDTRVGRLEGVVESLTRDIQEVSANISTMGRELGSFREMIGDTLTKMRDGFNDQLNTVTDRLTTNAKPQWQSIFAFVAMGLTVLGMAGAVVSMLFSGQAANIVRLQNDTAVVTERMFANQYEKGKSDAFASETSSHLAKLDTTLQREMTLMQQTTDSKIQGLDDKLQIEIKLDRKNYEDYDNRILEILKELRSWRLEHAVKSSENDAKLQAKQDMLIDQLHTFDNRMDRTDSRYHDDMNNIENRIDKK
jgi:hypothetical protein